ncbi:hypothetical protein HDU96_010374 [Phlyctochytrium bullatum]|nr:hypothetical protein HDU96_010374 [Phlyctochytrium bullatum]
MVTSHALRSTLKQLPFSLTRQHLRSYIDSHRSVYFKPVEEFLYPSSLPPLSGWLSIPLEDGVDGVYWAALFADLHSSDVMPLVAKVHQAVWTRDETDHFTCLHTNFYRPFPPDMKVFSIFRLANLSPGPLPRPLPVLMNPRITSIFFHLAGAGIDPHLSALAFSHAAVFSPDALPSFLSAL